MKLAFTLAALALSVAAQAMPKVGDTASYNFNYNGNAGQITQKIIATNGSQYTVEVLTVVGNRTQTQTEVREATNMLADAQVEQILTYCSQIGQAETVTVPLGTFPTCKITQTQDGVTQMVWIARGVAFGYVKLSQNGNGNTFTADSTSSTLGQ